MLSANLRRVWKTQDEKDRDASLRATWKREGVNVNVLQACNDIFDEGKSGDDDDTPLWHQKYSEGVWAKDRCEDGDEQLTLEEVIEERNACQHQRKKKDPSCLDEGPHVLRRPLESFASMRGFASNDATRVLALPRRIP